MNKISFRKALRIANKQHKHLYALRCGELDDSWVFVMGAPWGRIAYGPSPIRVMKDSGEAFAWNTMKNHKEYSEKYVKEIYFKPALHSFTCFATQNSKIMRNLFEWYISNK